MFIIEIYIYDSKNRVFLPIFNTGSDSNLSPIPAQTFSEFWLRLRSRDEYNPLRVGQGVGNNPIIPSIPCAYGLSNWHSQVIAFLHICAQWQCTYTGIFQGGGVRL